MAERSSASLQAKVRIYRTVLFLSISLNVAAALFGLFWPDAFTSTLNQPRAFPDTWPRLWGAQLLAINALYIPGYRDPVSHRWPNWCGIAIRLSFALFFFSQGDGFVRMGLVDAAAGLILLFAYLPVVRAAEKVR